MQITMSVMPDACLNTRILDAPFIKGANPVQYLVVGHLHPRVYLFAEIRNKKKHANRAELSSSSAPN